ncbi:MAG: hypothetical protein IIA10_03580 [Proteobacteria bacterium]|nr:hypothetical protein [Pseudomonadota bacterium]
MKTTIEKRGLHRRVTLTPENEDESWSNFRKLASAPDHYVEDAKNRASQIANNDPEYDRALDVLEYCREAQRVLDSPGQRDAFSLGVRLAQSIGHLNADRAWQKPVTAGAGAIRGGRKGAEVTHGPKGSKGQKYRDAFKARRRLHPGETKTASRKAVADEFGVNYKTVERHTKEK